MLLVTFCTAFSGVFRGLFQEVKTSVFDYIAGYYSQIRAHQHNAGLSPNESEREFLTEYKTAAKLS